MKNEGLVRSQGFKIYVMAEIPSNVILAKEFAKRFDGFSIGSNDLTQLTLGIGEYIILGEFLDSRQFLLFLLCTILTPLYVHYRS